MNEVNMSEHIFWRLVDHIKWINTYKIPRDESKDKDEAISIRCPCGWLDEQQGVPESKQRHTNNDKTNHAKMFKEKGNWYCPICEGKGSFANLLHHYSYDKDTKKKKTIKEIKEELIDDDPNVAEKKFVTPDEVDKYVGGLNTPSVHKGFRHHIKSRYFLSDETLDYWKIGMDVRFTGEKQEAETRITIPVFDKNHKHVHNLLRHLPGAKKKKSLPRKGYDSKLLYCHEDLDEDEYKEIVIFEGPLKVLAAIPYLNPINIGAVSGIIGKNWPSRHNKSFKNKTVYIWYDNDPTGQSYADNIAQQLSIHTGEIYLIKNPYGNDIHDAMRAINDEGVKFYTDPDEDQINERSEWFRKHLNKDNKFIPHVYTEPPEEINEDDYKETPLGEAFRKDPGNEELTCVETELTLAENELYSIPKSVEITCEHDDGICSFCVAFWKEKNESGCVKIRLDTTHPDLLRLVGSDQQKEFEKAVKRSFGQPACRGKIVGNNNEQIQFAAMPDGENFLPVALTTDEIIEAGVNYKLYGNTITHPKNAKTYYAARKVKRIKTVLERREFSDEDYKKCEVFKIQSGEELGEKVDDIIADIEQHRTQIFFRRDVHLCLIWHYWSILEYKVQGSQEYGTLITAISGGTQNGKSQIAQKFPEFLKVGVCKEIQNPTEPGMIGTCIKSERGKWSVDWGLIPKNHKGGMILDEFCKTLHKDSRRGIFASLCGSLSDKKVEMTKAGSGSRPANVRICFIQNPAMMQDANTTNSYNYGIEQIYDLTNLAQELRRIDVVLITDTKEQTEKGNWREEKKKRPIGTPKYSDEAFEISVARAWKNPGKVEWGSGVLDFVDELSEKFCNNFWASDLNIYSSDSFPTTLRRLAVATAGIVCNYADDEETLIIEKYHVQYVYDKMVGISEKEACNLKRLIERKQEANTIYDPEEVAEWLRKIGSGEKQKKKRDRFWNELLERKIINQIELKHLLNWVGPVSGTYDSNMKRDWIENWITVMKMNRGLKIRKGTQSNHTIFSIMPQLKELIRKLQKDEENPAKTCNTENTQNADF